jgi:hypothetical protein
MHKALPILCLLVLLASKSPAQFILNGGFEDSTFTANDTVPANWSADFFGFGFSSDAHSGNTAAEIWNWYSYARGWISYGAAADPFNGGGLPVSITPDRLTGYYKYIYGNNGGAADSALCEIMVYSHQNFTGARDTIAHVMHKLGPQAEYAAFEIPISYNLPGIPADSIVIRFHSSEAGQCSPTMECLYLFLDDLDLSTPTGLHVPLTVTKACNLYPSPSANGFQIDAPTTVAFPLQLEMYDLSGRSVFSATVLHETQTAIDPHLPAGNYVWKMTDRQGARFQGKWASR